MFTLFICSPLLDYYLESLDTDLNGNNTVDWLNDAEQMGKIMELSSKQSYKITQEQLIQFIIAETHCCWCLKQNITLGMVSLVSKKLSML